MRVTGQDRAKETQRCAKCGYVGRTVAVVMTLAATHDSPAEYAWACPECLGVETLDPWDEGEDDGDGYTTQESL